MKLNNGDYYCLRCRVHGDESIIVKIIDANVGKYRTSLTGEDYVFVMFIRLPDSPLYCNWNSYAKYGISIPISRNEFSNAKKLMHEEVVAIEL